MTKKTTASKWRYGCAKRVYETKIRGHRATRETSYELVEVYGPSAKTWTADAVVVTADSRKALVRALRRAADDVEKYDVIVEPDHIVRSFP